MDIIVATKVLIICQKNVLLKPYFQHEGHWYGNFLFHILTIYRKCILFQFLCCGMRVQILILKGFQKRHISSWKTGHDLLKNALLKISLQHNSHLHDNCLIYILTIYCEFLHFQFFCQMHTYAYSHRSSRSKCTHKSPKKQSYLAKKCFF